MPSLCFESLISVVGVPSSNISLSHDGVYESCEVCIIWFTFIRDTTWTNSGNPPFGLNKVLSVYTQL